MIKTEEWTKEQTELVDSLLYRIKNLCKEKWEDTYYFLDNVCLTEEEMEKIREISK